MTTETTLTHKDGNLSYLQKRHRYIRPYQNLVIKNNTTNLNYQVDIDADYLTIEGYKFDNINLTVDITVSGEGGLDTGSEANSTWYYIWAIGNLADTATSSLLSVQYPGSGTSPTLPDGYSIKECIGAVRNDSSGHFKDFAQRNNRIGVATTVIIDNAPETNYTLIALSVHIPQTAISMKGFFGSRSGTSGVRIVLMKPNNDSTDKHVVVSRQFFNTTGLGPYMMYSIDLTNTNIYYRNLGTSTSAIISISGYTI